MLVSDLWFVEQNVLTPHNCPIWLTVVQIMSREMSACGMAILPVIRRRLKAIKAFSANDATIPKITQIFAKHGCCSICRNRILSHTGWQKTHLLAHQRMDKRKRLACWWVQQNLWRSAPINCCDCSTKTKLDSLPKKQENYCIYNYDKTDILLTKRSAVCFNIKNILMKKLICLKNPNNEY